jgi:regulator of protease activity HflC (stomatin/prohibitin superfamily)
VNEPLFDHVDLRPILSSRNASEFLNKQTVEPNQVGLYFRDGAFVAALPPGTHAFWRDAGKVTLQVIDLRESTIDITGQEIMTADKVTLRINAVVTYRAVDAKRAITACEGARQALYRGAQLALRAVVGTFELDDLLEEKDAVIHSMERLVRGRAADLGLEIIDLGIRDVILPGEMKALMNRVIEARKAADANLITRREETAAMRSQANTARILESNPTLMRLRELDVLEKIAEKSKLNVVLGEKGLADRVVNLL